MSKINCRRQFLGSGNPGELQPVERALARSKQSLAQPKAKHIQDANIATMTVTSVSNESLRILSPPPNTQPHKTTTLFVVRQ